MRWDAVEAWLRARNHRPLPWLAAVAVLMAIQISPWWYPTPDAAAYLSIARSIALTHRLSNLGGMHLGYPPGYPLLISPAFLVCARPFLLLSMMHWAMAIIFMCGVYRWSRTAAPSAALILTVLTMVNAALWIYYRRTLSEMAFMAVMMWTVIALNSAIAARGARSSAISAAAGTVLLIVVAMIRETGALIICGFALAALLEVRRGRLRVGRALWMTAAVASPAAAGVAAFLIYDAATAHAAPSAVFGTHLNGLFNNNIPMLARIVEGLRLRLSEAGRLVVPGMFKAYAAHGQWLHVDMFIYAVVFGLIAYGWARMMRRRSDVLAAAAPFYFALYAVWAFDADTRYLLPLLPLLLVCLWFAIRRFTRWRLSALAILLLAHLAVALGYWTAVEIPRGRECNRQWTAAAALAPALNGRTDLVVAAHAVPQCARLMLSFLIDRPVPERTHPDEYRAARAILEPSADPDPPGFRVRQVAGPYKLLTADRAAR